MAAVEAAERYDLRTGRRTLEGREETRVFWVRTDDPNDSTAVVLNHVLIPRIGQPIIGDEFLRCADVTATIKAGSAKIWDVIAEYRTFKARDAAPEDDPFSESNRVSTGTWEGTEPVRVDHDGKPIVNSAGQEFEIIEREVRYPTLTIIRNEPSFSIHQAAVYTNAVNSDPYFGFSLREVRCLSINGQFDRRSGIDFFPTTYEFVFRTTADGWRERILDQGTSELVEAAGPPGPGGRPKRLQPITEPDEKGKERQLQQPVLLDGRGKRLPPGAGEVFVPVGGLGWHIYKERPFAPFGLE